MPPTPPARPRRWATWPPTSSVLRPTRSRRRGRQRLKTNATRPAAWSAGGSARNSPTPSESLCSTTSDCATSCAGLRSTAEAARSNVAARAPVALLQAPGEDPPRLDPKHLIVETGVHSLPARMKHLCLTPDFDAPRPPRLNRCEVVHDQGDLRVLVNVAPLLPLGEVVSADVDRVVLRVVSKRQRNDVGLTIRSGGRQPAQALAVQVFDLL